MNFQVEVTWLKLRTIAHSIMVQARFSEKYIHFALMYMTHHIFPAPPIRHLVNQDSEPTMPHKLETGTKLSLSNLPVLLCPFVVQKATAYIDTKELNMCHCSQKGFFGIFVGIPKHQKGCLIYVPSTQIIVFHTTLYLANLF